MIEKMWYIHTMKYYSVLQKKKKKLLTFATTQMALEYLVIKCDKSDRERQVQYISLYVEYENRQNKVNEQAKPN